MLNYRNNAQELHRAIEEELVNSQRKVIDELINKLYNHPIAMADEHWDFLKEVEKTLRDYRKDYL